MKDQVMIKNLSSFSFEEMLNMLNYIIEVHGIDGVNDIESDYDISVTYEKGNYYDTIIVTDN